MGNLKRAQRRDKQRHRERYGPNMPGNRLPAAVAENRGLARRLLNIEQRRKASDQ